MPTERGMLGRRRKSKHFQLINGVFTMGERCAQFKDPVSFEFEAHLECAICIAW